MFIEDKQIYLLAFRHVIVKGLHFDACLSCDQVFDDVGVGVDFHIVLYLASSKKYYLLEFVTRIKCETENALLF